MEVRVALCMVYMSEGGEEDYELKFIDEDDQMFDTLRVCPDGTLEPVKDPAA